MKKIRIGGVPEHFNMPWHLLLKSSKLKKKGIEASWEDYPGGTGAMIEALNENKIDMAMLLTEGAIKGIYQGSEYKIVSFFVDSPLIWGIHVPAKSDYQTMEDVKGKVYAISRYGSGSHLMSIVDAESRSWPAEKLAFNVVKDLDGARKALANLEADIFLWEKYTTNKYVQSGEMRRIDECPTPFPCFVICVNTKFLKKHADLIKYLLKQLFKTSRKLSKHAEKVKIIAGHFELDPKDVKDWIKHTRWTMKWDLKKKRINKPLKILKRLNLIDDKLKYRDVVFKL